MYTAQAFSKKGSRKGLVISSLSVGSVGVWWYEFSGDVQMFDVVITSVTPTTVDHITMGGMIVLTDDKGNKSEVSYQIS